MAFADLGFDVDIGPLLCTPTEAARQALENDVHIVALGSLEAGSPTIVSELRDELERQGRSDMVIAAEGVISKDEYNAFSKAGTTAIFGPGTDLSEAAERLIRELARRLAISLDGALAEPKHNGR